MWDNKKFQPEKISIIDFKIIKGQVETPEDFSIEKIDGHHLDNSLQLSFNLKDKLVKADFSVEIKSESKKTTYIEATGNFHFVYIFKVENLEELSKLNKSKLVELNPLLANALSSITYSTSRGVLLTRLQGTALQNFILPVIDPTVLLQRKA